MKTLRHMGVSVALLAIAGAITSASAFGAACAPSTGGACISKEGVLTESLVVLANQEAAPILEAEGVGTIQCEKGTAAPTLDETAAEGLLILPFDITFSEKCKLNGAENKECKVKEPILTANITGTLTAEEGTSGDASFSPEQGTSFATVTITGCEHEAIVHANGTQLCLLTQLKTELTLHSLNCEATEGLLNGTKKVVFLAKFDVTTEPEAKVGIKLGEF